MFTGGKAYRPAPTATAAVTRGPGPRPRGRPPRPPRPAGSSPASATARYARLPGPRPGTPPRRPARRRTWARSPWRRGDARPSGPGGRPAPRDIPGTSESGLRGSHARRAEESGRFDAGVVGPGRAGVGAGPGLRVVHEAGPTGIQGG